jgi:hypothetical protein
VGYADGLETTPACSADAVLLSLPRGTALPGKPGCISSPPASVGDKIKSWLNHITH